HRRATGRAVRHAGWVEVAARAVHALHDRSVAVDADRFDRLDRLDRLDRFDLEAGHEHHAITGHDAVAEVEGPVADLAAQLARHESSARRHPSHAVAQRHLRRRHDRERTTSRMRACQSRYASSETSSPAASNDDSHSEWASATEAAVSAPHASSLLGRTLPA